MTSDKRIRPPIDDVVALYADGWSLARIGTQFGYSSGAVRKWMVTAGVDRRTALDCHLPLAADDPAERELVAELSRLYIVEQLSLSEIGHRQGRSVDWVRVRLRRGGVKMRTTTFAAEEVPATVVDEMTRLYVVEEQTFEAIAAHFGRNRSWVSRHLEAAGVGLRPGGGRRLDVDEATIVEQYVDQSRSMSAIASDLGVGATVVRRVLLDHDVEIRGRGACNTVIDGDELRRLYVDEQLSNGEIAERLDVSTSGVGAALHRHAIPIRQPRVLDIDVEQLQRHLDDGLTNAEIALLHGVATYAVTLRLRAAKLRRPMPLPWWTRPTPSRLALHAL